MKNLIKPILISSLMGGVFTINAMEDDAVLARQFGLSVKELREQREMYGHFSSVSDPVQVPLATEEDDIERVLADSLGMNLSQYRHHLAAEKDAEFARRLAKEEENKAQAEQRRQEEAATIAYLRNLENKERLRREEADTAEFFRKMKLEEDKKLQEDASWALAFQLQQEEEITKQKTTANSYNVPLGKQSSLISHANELSRKFANSKEERPILENFMRIYHYLQGVAPESDVHALDTYVFGAGNNISHLVQVGNLYDIDDPKLTLAEVGQQMINFVESNPSIFANYKYQQAPVSTANIHAYLTSHFSRMDSEIGMCPAAREIWSRAWTLALKLYNQNNNPEYIRIIFDQALEGHLTQGGCIQGRIDRGFVSYVILLGRAGVGIF